jgi:hypothetical protein
MSPPRRPDPDPASLVRVTNAAGELIATIDPLTRQRRTVAGRLEATLTPQGWNLPTDSIISWPGSGSPPREIVEPIERTRWGKIRNREEGRIGRGVGGGRPRKVRTR